MLAGGCLDCPEPPSPSLCPSAPPHTTGACFWPVAASGSLPFGCQLGLATGWPWGWGVLGEGFWEGPPPSGRTGRQLHLHHRQQHLPPTPPLIPVGLGVSSSLLGLGQVTH
jgi:hypothetical protein